MKVFRNISNVHTAALDVCNFRCNKKQKLKKYGLVYLFFFHQIVSKLKYFFHANVWKQTTKKLWHHAWKYPDGGTDAYRMQSQDCWYWTPVAVAVTPWIVSDSRWTVGQMSDTSWLKITFILIATMSLPLKNIIFPVQQIQLLHGNLMFTWQSWNISNYISSWLRALMSLQNV